MRSLYTTNTKEWRQKILTSYLRTFLKGRLPGAIKHIVRGCGRSKKITKSFDISAFTMCLLSSKLPLSNYVILGERIDTDGQCTRGFLCHRESEFESECEQIHFQTSLLSVHLCPKNEALRRGKICALSLQVCQSNHDNFR